MEQDATKTYKSEKSAFQAKIEYFISIAQIVTLAIDYSTIENESAAFYAKYVFDQSMAQNKKLELFICVTEKLNVQNLINGMLPKDSKYEKYIVSLELLVGYFSWPDDILINGPIGAQN